MICSLCEILQTESFSFRTVRTESIQYNGVHGAAFNIDVIVDGALGTDGGSKITRESIEREETEEDLGAWDDVEEFHDGGDL